MTHNRRGARCVYNDGVTLARRSPRSRLMSQAMADGDMRVTRNTDAAWNKFSPHDYWRRNYRVLQAEDREIIRHVSHFFVAALAGRPRVSRGIDVGSGTNLYPSLLMLPWVEEILMTDFSASNVRWLRRQLKDPSNVRWLRRRLEDHGAAWRWQPFWRELQETVGYNQIGAPHKQLQVACDGEPGYAGVEQRSVFDLPPAQWDLGTMFFVAESITEDPLEFRAAVARFVGALRPGAPFAAAFMAGSDGYPVARTRFPALPITDADVKEQFTVLGADRLSVESLTTKHRVREGYAGMIVATGFACGQ
jgi:NNMT/PNMT/TEMT family